MELDQLQTPTRMPRYSNYDLSDGTENTKWYMKKKVYIWLILAGCALLVAVGVFFCGYYVGTSAERVESTELPFGGTTTDEPIEPEGEWYGSCPKLETTCPESYDGKPPVLLISLDGFRPDYLLRQLTPMLSNLSACGTNAPYMYPVYPSKTFPNHYSIVTGLNPSSHGIIDNNMFDPEKRKVYKIGRPEYLKSYWYEKEPIWVTAQNQGKRSALYFWPGSESVINGVRPNDYMPYKSSTPYRERVNKVLEWLDRPKATRPDFLTLYVNQPDLSAHNFGSGSRQVNEVLVEVDNMIKYLISRLQRRKILNCVNIIIVSDHGMANIKCSNTISLADYIRINESYTFVGAFGRIRMKNPNNTESAISDLQCKHDHMRTYPKELLPLRLHYSDNKRIEPIYIDLDVGWSIFNYKPGPGFHCLRGNHGYDNYFEDMQALFIAYGPSFRMNHTVEPFINTELYELMCELLNITGNPNNGTKGSLHHLLSEPKQLEELEKPATPIVATVAEKELEYNMRLNGVNCTCTQNLSRQEDIKNTTLLDMAHVPFGLPHHAVDKLYQTLRILYNHDYIEGYDFKYRLPLWASFTLTAPVKITESPVCWRGNTRIPLESSSKCSYYNDSRVIDRQILQEPLFPLTFADPSHVDEASVVTNSVPKHLNYLALFEKRFFSKISLWVSLRESVNVVTGPAFNFNHDELLPLISTIMMNQDLYGSLIVPTHYFYVLTWCQDKGVDLSECAAADLDVMSFLLPNLPIAYNCESPDDLIKKNVARVVDVEKLTGLSFFTDLPIYEAIRLRTKIPKL